MKKETILFDSTADLYRVFNINYIEVYNKWKSISIKAKIQHYSYSAKVPLRSNIFTCYCEKCGELEKKTSRKFLRRNKNMRNGKEETIKFYFWTLRGFRILA